MGNRNCGNCKYGLDEVCCNADSDEVADFTDRGFCCKEWRGGDTENEDKHPCGKCGHKN